MARKVTKKSIMAEFSAVIAINSSDAEHLLELREPFAYTEGVHGKNLLYRDSPNNKVVYCVGSHPFGNYSPDSARVRHYDKRAENILGSKYFTGRRSIERVYRVDTVLWELMYESLLGHPFERR